MKKPVGIIIARFQVDELSKGHEELIYHVRSRHDQIIIFLGVSPTAMSQKNPLDFFTRREMVANKFPDITTLPLMDVGNNIYWSKMLDARISEIIGSREAVLYGGRDGFTQFYSGKYRVAEFNEIIAPSGSFIRAEIANNTINSSSFRAGIIHTKMNEQPHVFSAVDVAVLNTNTHNILIRRRANEEEWGFIGGFVDPEKDINYEAAAIREVMEESGKVLINDLPQYIGNLCMLADWRYQGEKHKIHTTLFLIKCSGGIPMPSDDLEGGELRWQGVTLLDEVKWIAPHKQLLPMLKEYLITNGKYNLSTQSS